MASRVAAQIIRILLKAWIIKTPTSSPSLPSRSWLTGPWLLSPIVSVAIMNVHSFACLLSQNVFALVLSSFLITSSSWDCIWRMVSCAEADLGYRHGNISKRITYIVQKDENKRLLLTASSHILLTCTSWQFAHIKVHFSILWLFN